MPKPDKSDAYPRPARDVAAAAADPHWESEVGRAAIINIVEDIEDGEDIEKRLGSRETI